MLIDLGKDGKPPQDYKKIKAHLVFDVKHYGRHKAQRVIIRHLADIPVDSVYSGVFSLWGLQIMMFLVELNQLKTWATDIGNIYISAEIAERVYIIASPEFNET